MADEQEGKELQFDRAEFEQAPESMNCVACKMQIGDTYYSINGNVTCPRCKDQIEISRMEGSGLARFIKATFLGVLAAAIGAALYFGVAKLTGYEFGLIAIVVGLLVGGAVRYGSNRRGGWLYQLLAMFLTYSSIVATYIPYMLESIPKETAAVTEPAQPEVKPVEGQPAEGIPVKSSAVAMLILAVALLAFAFTVPFLSGFENIIGLIIIGIGLYEAWKMNKKEVFEVSGPFQVKTSFNVSGAS